MATALSGLFDSAVLIRNWRRRAGSFLAIVWRQVAETAIPAPQFSMPGSEDGTGEYSARFDEQGEISLAEREAALVAALLQGYMKF